MQLKKIIGADFTSASFIATISIFLLSASCQNEAVEDYEADIITYRKEKHGHFLSSMGPLTKAERQNFIGLNYYPPDSNFIVSASLTLDENPDTITLQTNTERTPQYITLGTLSFTINDTNCELSLYKPLDPSDTTLFLPFTDATNGISTYYTGRYIDINKSNLGKEVVFDFNKCYNPYCAYSDRYSCPIPPKSNRLSVEISAGEKLYKTNH